MYINIKQVKSNLKNEFKVDIQGKNGMLTYIAVTPWLDKELTFSLEDIQKVFFKDLDGNVIYTLKCKYIENNDEEGIPFKYLFTGEQHFCQLSIYDSQNIEHGKFYTKINGFLGSKICFIYGGKCFLGYDYVRGSVRYTSFFKESIQVAQLIKHLDIIESLDEHYLFIVDEYDYLSPLLSFFAIYIDYRRYGDNGILSK